MSEKPGKDTWTSNVPQGFPDVVKDGAQSGQNIKSFAESTSAHGLKYAFSEKSSRARRLAWFLAFLAALAYLSYQLVACSIDYYRYPTKSEYKMTRLNSMEFPTVTICNLGMGDASKMDDPQVVQDIYRTGTFCMWEIMMNSTLKDMYVKDVYRKYLDMRNKDVVKQVSWDVDDLIKFCIWNGEITPCDRILTPVWTSKGTCLQLNRNISHPLVSTRAGAHGGFFAFLESGVGGYTVSESADYGFKLLLHQKHDTPDIYSQGIMLSPGFSYHVSFVAHKIKYLPHPYKAQGDLYCSEYPTLDKEDGLQLETGPLDLGRLSLTSCVSTRASAAATDLCGCDVENCTLYGYLSCYKPNFQRIYDEATKTNLLGCPIPCTIRSYRPVISQAAFPSPDLRDLISRISSHNFSITRDRHLALSLYFEDLILRELIDQPVYNSLSMMGMLGGNMGLLLGASILTLAELLEFLLLLIWHVIHKHKKTAVTALK